MNKPSPVNHYNQPEGRPEDLYIISNGNCSAEIINLGDYKLESNHEGVGNKNDSNGVDGNDDDNDDDDCNENENGEDDDGENDSDDDDGIENDNKDDHDNENVTDSGEDIYITGKLSSGTSNGTGTRYGSVAGQITDSSPVF